MLSFPETLDLSEFSGNGIPGKNVIAQNLKKLPGNGNRALCMAESPLCRNISAKMPPLPDSFFLLSAKRPALHRGIPKPLRPKRSIAQLPCPYRRTHLPNSVFLYLASSVLTSG